MPFGITTFRQDKDTYTAIRVRTLSELQTQGVQLVMLGSANDAFYVVFGFNGSIKIFVTNNHRLQVPFIIFKENLDISMEGYYKANIEFIFFQPEFMFAGEYVEIVNTLMHPGLQKIYVAFCWYGEG